MTWAFMAPLLAIPQGASAALAGFKFGSTTTIVTLPGGDLANNATFTETGTSGSFVYTFPRPTGGTCLMTINNLKSTMGGTADSGNLSGCGLTNQLIVVQDPGQIGPGNNKSTPPPAGGGTTAEKPVNCEAARFTWLICDAITALVGVVDKIRDDVIVPFLKEAPLNKNQPDVKPVYDIWSAFRNVASVFFILIFFLVIIGTAIGFDNYTIKKVLPHLVAGAILVPFSWYLCAFLIDIGNVLGQGIVSLMTDIIGTPTIDLTHNFTTLFLGTGGGLGTFALIGAATVLGFCAIVSLLIAFAGVFLTLVFRKILILMLIVVSPFAILLWILPNTEKWFREWWQNFFKLVMLYPIIMMLIEIGRLFSKTSGATATVCAAADKACIATSWVAPFFAIAGLTVPLFVVPFAFKFAGKGLAMGSGAIGKLGGGLDKRYGKDSDLAKDLSEGRQRKNVAAAKIAESDAKGAHGLHKAALNRKAAMNWRRAGLAGSTGSAKLRRGEAVPKADKELSTIDADNRMSKEGRPEDFRNRRLSTTQSILEERAASRGTREGVLDGYHGAGKPSALDKQNQARINTRDNYLAGAGTAKGEIERDKLNESLKGTSGYVSAAKKVSAAQTTAALQSSEKLGGVNAVVDGGAEAEKIMQKNLGISASDARNLRLRNVTQAKTNTGVADVVAAQQTANTNVSTNAALDARVVRRSGGGISLAQARSMRLQNLSAATHTQEREKIGATEGQINARNAITATSGQENLNKLVTGETLAAREQLASARTIREARADFQAQPKGQGYLSTADVMTASRAEANKRIGASIGAQQQEIAQEKEDIAKAQRDGNPAPSLADHVIHGTESAKAKTAQDSAQRLASVNAVREGTAASTREHTENAVFDAESNLRTSNDAIKGGNQLVEEKVAQELASNPGMSTITAQRNVRGRALSAAGTASRLAAERKRNQEIEGNVGIANNYEDKIAAEVAATGATYAVAEAAVRSKRISAAGTSARTTSERKARKEDSADLGIERDINEKIDAEIASGRATSQATGPITNQERADAATKVRQRDLTAIGTKAEQEAGFASRTEATDAIGLQTSLDTQIGDEAARIVDAATPGLTGAARVSAITAAHATASKTVHRDNLNNIGDAAEIEAQNNQSKKVSEAKTAVDTYNDTLPQATVEAAQNAAHNAAYTSHLEQAQNDAEAATRAAAIASGTNATASEISQARDLAKHEATDGAIEAGKAAGNTARVQALDAVKRGQVSHEEMVKATIRAKGAATQESTKRLQTAAQANTNALAQAATTGTTRTASERLAAYTANEVAKVASESASVGARELELPGTDYHQTYQEVEAQAERGERTNILTNRVNAASQGDHEWPDLEKVPGTENDFRPIMIDVVDATGKTVRVPKMKKDRLGSADPSPANLAAWDKDARINLGQQVDPITNELMVDGGGKPIMGAPIDSAKGIALIAKLTQTGSGIVRLHKVQSELFGSTDDQTIDPAALGGRSRELWEQVQSKTKYDKSPSVFAPQSAVSDSMSSELFASQNYRDLESHLDYVIKVRDSKPELLNQTAANIHDTLTNAQSLKKLGEDEFKQLFDFIQDDEARAKVLGQDKGQDLIDTIEKRGIHS
jgi:hypothetical protein